MPPADEVNILRGQIFMMKNQILYERNKRELHAKRNRRLLRKITTANALEEQTKAQVKLLNLFFNFLLDAIFLNPWSVFLYEV